MRKVIFLLIAVLSLGLTLQAQEFSKKELKQIEKDAKNEAKEMIAKGWEVLPGGLPLQRQFEEKFKMDRMKVDGEKKYIIESATAVGTSYNAAKLQAMETAKITIANSLESEIAAITETEMANSELSTESGESVSKTVASAKSMVQNSLGRLNTVVEAHKKMPNKNVQVTLYVAYDYQKAIGLANRAVKKELKVNLDNLRKKLDAVDFKKE